MIRFMMKKQYVFTLFFVLSMAIGLTFASDSQESPEEAAFNKLAMKIKSQKLSSKELEKLGFGDEKEDETEIVYEGKVYNLELRSNAEVELSNLQIECRFFYTEERQWFGGNVSRDKALQRRDESEQKHIAYSLSLTMGPRSKEKMKTDPFVVRSHSHPSHFYYKDGSPDVVEAKPDGLWVKVTYKTPAGETLTRDFCEPKSLSSRVEWN